MLVLPLIPTKRGIPSKKEEEKRVMISPSLPFVLRRACCRKGHDGCPALRLSLRVTAGQPHVLGPSSELGELRGRHLQKEGIQIPAIKTTRGPGMRRCTTMAERACLAFDEKIEEEKRKVRSKKFQNPGASPPPDFQTPSLQAAPETAGQHCGTLPDSLWADAAA